MEIKIFCDCGSKYKFDTEPLNGKLPGPVHCPVCGADGTAKGNAIVATQLAAGTQAAAAPISIPFPASAPAAPGTGAFVSPAIPRSSKQAAATAVPANAPTLTPPPAPVAAAPMPIAPVAGPSKLSVAAVHSEQAVTTAEPPIPVPHVPIGPAPSSGTIPPSGPSLIRGYIGVALASFVSLLVWFGVTSILFWRLKWLAIGVGALTGWAGRLMGKQKSPKIALGAGIATVAVILLGSVWSGMHQASIDADQALKSMYDDQVAYAKEAVKAKTDDEIVAVIENAPDETASESDTDIQKVKAKNTAVDARRIAEWKRKDLPELRKFASGQISRIQFERENRPIVEAVAKVGGIVSHTFRISLLLWMIIGATAAYKVALK